MFGKAANAVLPAAMCARARRLRLVLSDVDGVLTDTGVYYAASGEIAKRFSLRDGMAVEMLREAGIETAFVTRERSRCVVKRAEKLQLRYLYTGVRDKRAYLSTIFQDTGRRREQVAYIGDDINDLGIIAAIAVKGITGAPQDAVPEVRSAVHYCCERRGGYGAFREFAEWLLAMRREMIGDGGP